MTSRVKILDEKHHVGMRSPDLLIAFINETYPQYAGLCVYSKQQKRLESKSMYIADFYFDPHHGVLHVTGWQTKTINA